MEFSIPEWAGAFILGGLTISVIFLAWQDLRPPDKVKLWRQEEENLGLRFHALILNSVDPMWVKKAHYRWGCGFILRAFHRFGPMTEWLVVEVNLAQAKIKISFFTRYGEDWTDDFVPDEKGIEEAQARLLRVLRRQAGIEAVQDDFP